MPKKREVRTRNSLKAWAERSVWSFVCAMELGLLTDSCLKGVSLKTSVATPRRSTSNRGRKPDRFNVNANNKSECVLKRRERDDKGDRREEPRSTNVESSARPSSKDRNFHEAGKSRETLRIKQQTTDENFWKWRKTKFEVPIDAEDRDYWKLGGSGRECELIFGSVEKLGSPPTFGCRSRSRVMREELEEALIAQLNRLTMMEIPQERTSVLPNATDRSFYCDREDNAIIDKLRETKLRKISGKFSAVANNFRVPTPRRKTIHNSIEGKDKAFMKGLSMDPEWEYPARERYPSSSRFSCSDGGQSSSKVRRDNAHATRNSRGIIETDYFPSSLAPERGNACEYTWSNSKIWKLKSQQTYFNQDRTEALNKNHKRPREGFVEVEENYSHDSVGESKRKCPRRSSSGSRKNSSLSSSSKVHRADNVCFDRNDIRSSTEQRRASGNSANASRVSSYSSECESSEEERLVPYPREKNNDPRRGTEKSSVRGAYETRSSAKWGKKQASCSSRRRRKVTATATGNSGRENIIRESEDRRKPEMPRANVSLKDQWENQDVRRVTRGSTRVNKENFVGKLVWGFCSGWWPALIVDAEHVGMLPEAGKLWVYWIGESRISLLNERTQIEPFSCNLQCRITQDSKTNAARIRAIEATVQMLRKRFSCALTKPYSTWIENNSSESNKPLDEIKFYPYPPRVQRRLDCLKERNAKVTEKYLLDQRRSPNQATKLVDKAKESTQRYDVDLTRLSLKEQHPGIIAWAKIAGHNWWPAMIIDYRDCCMREPSFACQWIMWYGDYKLSEVNHHLFLKFDKGLEKMRDYINNTKKHAFLVGVLQAAKDYCSRLKCESDNWTLTDVFKYFSKTDNSHTQQNSPKTRESIKIYDKYSAHIVKKLNEIKYNASIDDNRQNDIKGSDDLQSVTSGIAGIEKLCLKCLKISNDEIETHPYFEGSLCKECSEEFKPRMFVFGNDGKCFYCTVCAGTGTVIICDKEDCPRVYCTACMKHLLCPKTYDDVLLEDPWECFLCKSESTLATDAAIKPRPNWKDKIIDMFRTTSNSNVEVVKDYDRKRKIRVLSLFDGLSTGLLVLLKLGLAVDVYYASEIDNDALMVSAAHFGDRIIHLGNVKDITRAKIKEMTPIDLLIGGSPCNDLSLANPARLGLYDPKGTGVLFFEYCRIMKLVRKANDGHPLFWLYENVASMPTEYRLAMNKHLGQEPDVIDSADFSPQHRLRLYWHNLPIEPHSLSSQGEQDVQDILTPHCQRYALVKKIRTVTTKVNSLKQGKSALKPILMKDESDSLWITELEEIFGFPRHYTDVKNLSATKRQKLIGKSWSVQTLTAILQSICPFYECTSSAYQYKCNENTCSEDN